MSIDNCIIIAKDAIHVHRPWDNVLMCVWVWTWSLRISQTSFLDQLSMLVVNVVTEFSSPEARLDSFQNAKTR